jgi:RyR domain
MNETAIERYIKLISKEELNKDDIKTWYHCVVKNAPSGLTKTICITDDTGKPETVYLIHRIGEMHGYLVPLTRDLNDNEVDKIVKAFAIKKPELDFSVETNETKLFAKDNVGITLDAARHLALCNALEKQKHENWVRERTNSGWRYGIKFDADEKTHPLILSWTDLPDKFKQPDMEWPQKLIHLLNDEGYAVIQKDELNSLLRNIF